jgi:1-phosphofructokinase
MVFAPAPQLTVTVEQRGDKPDIHVHAGGQGVWQARMVRSLGVPVVFCAAFGGEAGHIARHLIADEGVEVHGVDAQSRSGAYVQDRRGGERIDIAEVVGDPLTRHELDELYGIALTEGLRARVAVLSGPAFGAPVIPPGVYRRLACDLTRNSCVVLADLSGDYLSQAVAGGLRLVKVSHEQLVSDGRVADDGTDIDALIKAMCQLRAEGAGTVLVTRAEHPALALIGDEAVEVVTPRLEPADSRGAGDSTTAGIAASLANGDGMADAIRTGAAAGALNVTRHGLGTGRSEAVAELRQRVRLVPIRTTRNGEPRGEGADVQTSPDQLAERMRRP